MEPPAYSERFDRAVQLTLTAFRPHFRKCSPVPYVTHLFAVCALVGEHGGDEDQMIAALLHDYLEDIEGSSVDLLEAEFGGRVARMVLALSDTVVRPKPPWEERKERYLAALRHKEPEVKLISAADKLHNCRSIVRDHLRLGDAVFERFRPAKEQTLWYYRSCVDALAHDWAHRLVIELDLEVARLHEQAGVDLGPLRAVR